MDVSAEKHRIAGASRAARPRAYSAGAVVCSGLLAMLPCLAGAAEPGVSPDAPARSAAAPTEPTFPIKAFEIDGATRVGASSLQEAVAPFTGEARHFSDIEDAVLAIKAAYERAGITAVQVLVPEQALDSGVVRLHVDEVRLARVEIQGTRFRSEDNVRRATPSLSPGEIPVDTGISSELRLANENPGRQMQVTFGQDEGGELAAVLRVADRESLVGQMTLDNTGSQSTGQWRLGASLQHANLLDRDVVGTLQLQTSPGHESDVRIAMASLRAPLYELGLLVEATALHSSVDSGKVQTSAGSYLLASSGDTFGFRVTRLLPRSGAWEPRLSAGYEIKTVQSDVKTVASGPSVVPDIVLRPLTLTYSGQWRQEGLSGFAALAVSRNLPGGTRGSEEAFAKPGLRAGANPRYHLVRPAVSLSLPVTGVGSVEAQWSAQFTPDALVSAEQFGIGGDGSVRGFNGRVVSGDRGQRFSLELQSLMRTWIESQGIAVGWQAFAEAGHVNRNLPQPGEKPSATLASLGGGLRLAAFDHLSMKLDLGVVVRGAGFAQRGDRFGHVSMAYGF